MILKVRQTGTDKKSSHFFQTFQKGFGLTGLHNLPPAEDNTKIDSEKAVFCCVYFFPIHSSIIMTHIRNCLRSETL